MVKSLPPLTKVRFLWRDGRAAEGACLENMFGESQRGFESHSLRLTIRVSALYPAHVLTILDLRLQYQASDEQLYIVGEVPEWLNGLAC
ncbi:MAG: hypothetical protein RIR73_124 [Chloroflexota bacterium]